MSDGPDGAARAEAAAEKRRRAHRTRLLKAPELELARTAGDREGDEIGIVESLDDLTPEQAALVRDELDRRYFTPLIERVESLKEEFGYSYWTVHTDAGHRRFTVQSGKNNVTMVGEGRLVIVDVDGNRFEVADYTRLDRSVLRTLEGLL